MVSCTRASILLSLVLLWSALTVIHFSSLSSPVALVSFIIQPSDAGDTTRPISALGRLVLSEARRTNSRRSLLDAFKDIGHPTLPLCKTPIDDPRALYSLRAVVEDRPDSGPGVSATVSMVCQWSRSDGTAPRAGFRFFTTGDFMTSLPPDTVLQPGQQSLTVYVRTPDPSDQYSLRVKLMAWNHSDWMLSRDYPNHYVITDNEKAGTRWFDAEIPGSPFNFTIAQSRHGRHRVPDYHETKSLKAPYNTQIPLCFSAEYGRNASLAGRLQLGPRHERIAHQWWSDNIYDEYDAIWAPYDCYIDYTLSLSDALRKVKWLSIVGDSNMRGLFGRICELAMGESFHGDPAASYLDMPKLCLLDNGKTIVTFSSWFVGKVIPIYPMTTFRDRCAAYTENVTLITTELYTIPGWPECKRADESIQNMLGPGLTYFSWGSHAAEFGANAGLTQHFRDELFANTYFHYHPTIVALTEDVDASMIPEKFGPQYVYRNNERIHAVNQIENAVVGSKRANWPVDVLDKDGQLVEGFTPIIDVFSPTHAASEVLHGDAVHFWWDVEVQIARWLTHYIHYAPQLQPGANLAAPRIPSRGNNVVTPQ